jgi:prepilin-type processing-associated H-X9-DG protein
MIAILAAILFPVFARAREKARQSSCLSNMKQIALGVLMYAQDYDERLPMQHHVSDTSDPTRLLRPEGNCFWFVRVEPYLKNEQILQCPSGRYDYVRGAPDGGDSVVIDRDVDYGWNYNFCYIQPVKLARITEPASTVLLCEQEGTLPYGRWFNQSDSGSKNFIWRYDQHNGGSNYSFCDGHSKWVSGERVPHGSYTPPYASRDFRMDPVWP